MPIFNKLAATVTFATFVLTAQPAAAADPVLEQEQLRRAALKWEIGYLALSAVDAAETIHCLDRDTCQEGNPIFGKHPSPAKLILGKVVFGAIHFAVFDRMRDRNPKAAMRLAQISAGVQGGVVLLNLRVAFK
jgi:hypothetical protein